jgi:hypothetical protein
MSGYSIVEEIGIMKRSKSYDDVMLWIVNTDGKKVIIKLNGTRNHFGRKHLLLPLTDEKKEVLLPEVAAEKRFVSRNTKNEKHTPKYNIKKVIPASTVLNLRPNAGPKGIDQKTAAVAFAKALCTAVGDPKTGRGQVTVDFDHVCCVYTYSLAGGGQAESKMKVGFQVISNDFFEIDHCEGAG